jgi:hypothetical protein
MYSITGFRPAVHYVGGGGVRGPADQHLDTCRSVCNTKKQAKKGEMPQAGTIAAESF